jgi:hypothetical protein
MGLDVSFHANFHFSGSTDGVSVTFDRKVAGMSAMNLLSRWTNGLHNFLR